MRFLLVIGMSAMFLAGYGQTTSWRGTSSSAWATASNWSNGVPSAIVDAILGDANFTGTFQPSVTAASNCRSLTVGGSRATTLTVSAALTIASDVVITSLGTLSHTANTITVRGNWSVTGTYTPTVATATVVFGGTAQTINNTTTFSRLTINSGSTTSLATNITVTNAFVVGGILDPVDASKLVTLTGSSFTINSLGRIKVYASTFSGNYSANPTTIDPRGIIEYASSSVNQTVAVLGYGTLTISGGTVKALAGNTTLQSTSNAGGNVTLTAGTLDLGGFTLNRNAAGGGTFSVSNGAQLLIGGTNSFPTNYNTTTLGASSTVVYGGNNQTITSKTYGHLVVSGISGSVTKTFPATAMTVAGNFTSTAGTATSVTCNANAAITIKGNVSIGASTVFNGGTGTHILSGNWTNNGTFNGNTSTVRFNLASGVIGGAGVQNFNNVTVAGSGVTCSSTNLVLSGNLATTGTGTFTHGAGSTITFSGTTKTITGTGINLSNVVVTGSVTTTASFTIGGNITTSGSFGATAGTVTFSGASAVVGGAGTTTFYAVVVTGALGTTTSFSMRSNLSGTGKLTATAGTVSFIGTSTISGAHDLFNATVNGTRLQLGANSTVSIAGALTITSGTFNTTTTVPNTLIYNGSGNQNIAAATYNNLVLANGGTKTALGAILPRGNFTINSGVTFNAASFTHTLSGNWINQGTFVQSTSTITFSGTANSTITGATTFNILTLNKSTATTTLTLNNNVNAVTVNMTQGQMLTGSNSITITGTRAGNAIILGTITRTHAFTANTSYAFEGPNSTITFTTITGSVTSVTVTVLSAPVADFPSLNSVNRSYNVTVSNTGTYVATLRLHYLDTELNGDVEANLSLWRFVAGSWTSYGKTSNDATNNWVQRTLQSDISGRWTFYDGSVTHVWTGTTSTAWTTATNWKAGVVPTSVDNILIGTETFTNQPTITTAITAKSIVFGSIKAASLTIGGASGSLTVTGNVAGDWAADQTHTINVGSRILAIAGDLTLSNGSNARKIQLTISTGTTTVTGSVIQPGAGAIVFTGAGAMSVGTDYIYSGGTFTAGTGTVTYNGSGSQVMAGGIVYYNLIVSKPAGVATMSTASTVNGSFTASSLSEVSLDAQLNVLGSVSFGTGTILDANAATLNVGGNWSFAGTLNATTGAVVFNGTGNQSISQSTFNDVIINKTAGVAALSNDVVVNGDLIVTAGSLDLVNFSANRSATGGGSFILGNGASLSLAGTSNFPANYDTQTLDANSSVMYNGTAQNITPATYGNLILSNTGTKSFIAGSTTQATNLTISAATVLPATAALMLKGNLVNNSSFNIVSGSTIEFSGNATQTISGTSVTDFQDITVSNTASPGVSVESNQNLRGVLTLEPNATFDADGSANTSVFLVTSSADNPTQDGAIDILPAGASVVGNVTVQRYMTIEGPSGGRIYRYVSSPVKNATVADMQHEIPITGPFTGSSVCSGCTTSASMLIYDETVTTGGINGGYTGFPTSSNTETFQTGRGYAMFVRGNLLTSALWDLRGPINSGAINLPVSFTSSGITADDGWNLVGNPYPSTIDWNAATGWDKNNINGTIYIRDNGGTSGQFATWNGVVGTNGGSQYIAAGQAFWVKADGTLPSLSLDENVKVPRTQSTFFRQTASDNLLRITLSKDGIRDETVIHFRSDATRDFDEEADALKVANIGFNLSTQLAGQNKLAINSLNLSDCSPSVPLLLDNVAQGTYSLSFDNLDSFTSGTSIILTDNFTHTITDTRLNPSYSFNITSDIASADSARFVVNFIMQPAPMDYSISNTSVCPGVDATIELAQTSDRVKYQVMVNDVEVFSDFGNGGSEFIRLPAAMLITNENSVRVAAIPDDACGLSTEKTTTLTVVKAAEPTTSVSGNICREGVVTFTAAGAEEGQQYRWYESEDDSISIGIESFYTTPTLRKSHTYYVSIESGLGCASAKVPVQADVINFEDPVITYADHELSIDYPGTKQWYFNDGLLPNDTLSFITPKQNGVYSVVIPVQSCVAKATYEFIIMSTGEGTSGNSSALSVYPNPVKDYVYITSENTETEIISIFNLSGQRVGTFDLTKESGLMKGKYNMDRFPAGVYFLVAEGRSGITKVKVIKE